MLSKKLLYLLMLMRQSDISIIIPVLNEEKSLKKLLPYLAEIAPQSEIIVSDCDSQDRSVIIAKQFAKVVHSAQGRGVQMNTGAEFAGGEILWFIHADCFPHPESVETIMQTMQDPDIIGGGFVYRLNALGVRFRIAEKLSNWKNRLLKLLYGDMGIFVRRKMFDTMGGYAEIPLMEDMEFSCRLKKEGRIKILTPAIRTSARRWLEEGYWKCAFRSWFLQASWALGVSPYKLAKWYKFK